MATPLSTDLATRGSVDAAVTASLTADAPANVTKAAAVVGVATKAARADHKHDVSTAVVGAIAVGDAAAEGTATSLARSDHVHALAAPSAPANVTKAAASAGVAATVARSDHKHDVTTAAPSAGIGAGNTEGSSASLARADHNHTLRTGATDLTIGTIADGDLVRRSGTSLVGASVTTVEKDLGSTAAFRGSFTITDAAIVASSKLLVWQAPGPYTGKGTRADEAEAQPVSVVSVEPGSGSALVRWQTPPGYAPAMDHPGTHPTLRRVGLVRGNVKFTYVVL